MEEPLDRAPAFEVLARGGLPVDTACLVDTWRTRRRTLNTVLDEALGNSTVLRSVNTVDELIVGGGYHAAIYAAMVHRLTGRKVVVLERERLGGILAVSPEPVFYLNSRNRAGALGAPGTGLSLNTIPGGVVQPADLNGKEYQSNAEFAFAIRASLGLYGRPARLSVSTIEGSATRSKGKYFVGGRPANSSVFLAIYANRVIVATGVGEPRLLPVYRGGSRIVAPAEAVFTFPEFMALVGDRGNVFPLRGWKRVAVIGAGNSGDAVIETLMGQGPSANAPASLDTVERVTWWGQSCVTREDFEKSGPGGARSRYAGIGRFMPRADEPNYFYRVDPRPSKVRGIAVDGRGLRVIYGADRSFSEYYDHIVICAGVVNRVNDLIRSSVDDSLTGPGASTYPFREELVRDDDGTPIARKVMNAEVYKIGPCAELPVTASEQEAVPALAKIPVNSAAAFRYAGRTERLAMKLHSRGS